MNAYFCTKTGLRIVAPGVCKAVDPDNGQDEFIHPSVSEAKPAKSDDKPAHPAKTDHPAATAAKDK